MEEEEEKKKREYKKLLMRHRYFGEIFASLSEQEKNWILKYLSSGKGVIPYKKIKHYESLKLKPADSEFL